MDEQVRITSLAPVDNSMGKWTVRITSKDGGTAEVPVIAWASVEKFGDDYTNPDVEPVIPSPDDGGYLTTLGDYKLDYDPIERGEQISILLDGRDPWRLNGEE